MASAAQFEANRLKFGLFSTQNCVRPEETAEYAKLSKALWKDLNPVGAVEELLAVEIVRAAWRLHRCVVTEAEDGANPATQASVDRARASVHASMRRLLNDLRALQSDRWLRAEVLREGFDEASFGVADAHRVIKGLRDNEHLKAEFLMAPIGIDPLNQTIQTQSASQPSRDREGVVGPPVSPASGAGQSSPRARTIQTQSVQEVGQAISSPAKEMPVSQAPAAAPALAPAPDPRFGNAAAPECYTEPVSPGG